MNTLLVRFDGAAEDLLLEPGEELTFGRAGELRLDEGDDPYLHRLAGSFSCLRGTWWLHNLGKWIDLLLVVDGEVVKRVMSGRSEPLTYQDGLVRLHSGKRGYEISYRLAEDPSPQIPPPEPPARSDTEDFGVIELQGEQKLLVVALCEPRLRNRTRADLPSNEEIAARFQWSLTKFNRKLDGICRRLHEREVRGLVGDSSEKAARRREVLVDHVLAKRMITKADLSLLVPYGPIRPRRQQRRVDGPAPILERSPGPDPSGDLP